MPQERKLTFRLLKITLQCSKTILLHFQPSSSPGDCTFEHDTCQWLFPGSVSEQTFFWNRTNADELKAQGLQGPGFDHVGNRKRK